jgi:hypothetical protein
MDELVERVRAAVTSLTNDEISDDRLSE